MQAKKINISEIARRLGVSKSTVSKALNGSHEISEATKLKIQKFAARHNYRPNKIAVNLKSGQTKTIGVIVPSLQNFFFARVLRGIEKVASDLDYSIITCMSYESLEKEKKSIELLENGMVDGFIVALAQETQIKKETNHINEVIDNNKPVVMFDRVTKKIICNQVVVDDLEAVYMATKHLINLHCKNIALASTIDHLSVGKQRKKGYKKALKEAGLPIKDSRIVTANVNNLDVKIVHLLKQESVNAILALDEDAVFAAYRAAKFVGIKMPDNLAVIGYISDKMAKNLTPSLSTLNQHGIELGSKATQLLIERLQNTQREPFQKIQIKTTLAERESTKGYMAKITLNK